jgi:RNA polymerase sigma-70 factor, ECF subfamily
VGSIVPTQPIPALGDLAAVYAEHHGFVWRVLLGLGVPRNAVEDATQDVFLVLHRRRAELEDRGTTRGLLFGIARRIAPRHRRVQPNRDALRLVAEPMAPRAPDESVARRQAAELVTVVLDGLDEDKRMVFVLADIEGLSMPEIAGLLGLKLNTAYSRLRLARHEFHRRVERLRDGSGGS